MIENDSSLVTGVNRATIADIFMSPFNGFKDAIDVCVFVLFLGGFLGIVTKTKALDAGIAALVRKLKGNYFNTNTYDTILNWWFNIWYGRRNNSILHFNLFNYGCCWI